MSAQAWLHKCLIRMLGAGAGDDGLPIVYNESTSLFQLGGTTLTIAGLINAVGTTGVHKITNADGSNNTLEIKNTNADGFSAIVWRGPTGVEIGAMGVGTNNAPANAFFIEMSMIPFTYASAPEFYVLQTTNFNGSWSGITTAYSQYKRFSIKKNGLIALYPPGTGDAEDPVAVAIQMFLNTNTIVRVGGGAAFTAGDTEDTAVAAPATMIGFKVAGDYGFINAVNAGTDNKPIKINEAGGAITLAGAVTCLSGLTGDCHATNSYSAVAAGTVYSLTNTAAALDFGTTDPSITISVAGRYRVQGRVNLKYNGATMVAARTVTLKLRRTNNTAADLTNGSTAVVTAVTTTLTGTFLVIDFEADLYTATAGDIITIFGSVDTVPSAGSLDCSEAWIKALPA